MNIGGGLSFGLPTVLFTGGVSKSFHTFQPCHTSEVQEINQGGFKYWAYYTLGGNNLQPPFYAHLARSNSLTSGWVDYGLVLANVRWPSVHFDGSLFHMFWRENSSTHTTYRSTSADGLSWTLAETIGNGANPYIWKNPNDNQWYLFSADLGGTGYQIFYRTAASITGLAASAKTVLLDINVFVGAPTIFYKDGYYWLFVEEYALSIYRMVAYRASNIAGPYERINIITAQDEACPIVMQAGSNYHFYYCPRTSVTNSYWDIAVRTAILP